MDSFKRASDITEKSKKRDFPPEMKDIITKHLNNFNHPITVTSTLVELNKNGLNPSRNIIRRYLDKLVDSGYATVRLKGNIYEYTSFKKR